MGNKEQRKFDKKLEKTFKIAMNIKNLEEQHSVLNQFIAEIRDKEIQRDRIRFRRNLERIGEIFAYEISKTLKYKAKDIETPLGTKTTMLPEEQPILATILRAGLPLHNGLLNYFDQAGNAFISAYRKYDDAGNFDIHIEYASSPSTEDKTLILSDPMLATASSMALAFEEISKKGQPLHTHLVTIVASTQGIEAIKKEFPSDAMTLWVGSVDEKLSGKAYIIPGLGDAGDLAFGPKID